MLLKEQIDKKIEQILLLSKNLQECKGLLLNSQIAEAIKIISEDKTFKTYFFTLLRKVDFGTKVDINSKDIVVISHLLGPDIFKLIVYSYFIFFKIPKNWKIFNTNAIKIVELNAKILSDWNRLISYLEQKNDRNLHLSAYALLSIVVCEIIFSDLSHNFEYVVRNSDVSYDRILKNLYGTSLFDLVCKTAGFELENLNEEDKKLSDYLRILLIYEFCRPEFSDMGFDMILNLDIDVTGEMLVNFKKALAHENNL
ncbi:hypothetical protein [Campylobacter sp. 7477a]|uniref:hypothetical protein n=1 Tax=Campylobacter sp. 7477a TaxID=2735741 RepID=UPI003015700F|nr:hypothetical protein [Campylobacter sp. 7477a]